MRISNVIRFRRIDPLIFSLADPLGILYDGELIVGLRSSRDTDVILNWKRAVFSDITLIDILATDDKRHRLDV